MSWGSKRSHLVNIRYGMIWRCENQKCDAYKYYGGRGIRVCEEWKNSIDAFVEWGIKNGYEIGLTIERIDNNKGYEPSNCKWATKLEQGSNKRNNVIYTVRGRTGTLTELCRIFGKEYRRVRDRILLGWDIDNAMFTEKQRDSGISVYMTVCVDGITSTVKDAAKRYGMKTATVMGRIRAGWQTDRVFKEPVRTLAKGKR